MRIREGFSGTAVSDVWAGGKVSTGSRWPALLIVIALSGALALQASSSGASPVPKTVAIGSGGPSPSALSLFAGLGVPNWHNLDGVQHTIAFLNGRCSLTIEPGSTAVCPASFWSYVGRYPYTVGGVTQPDGVLIVQPAPRKVTLRASRIVIRKGSGLTLSGTFSYAIPIAPPAVGQPVVLMRRLLGSERFLRFKTVRPRLPRSGSTYEWHVVIHPRKTATYRARDFLQPSTGTVWMNTESAAVTVRVQD